jgi:hypothetical protein
MDLGCGYDFGHNFLNGKSICYHCWRGDGNVRTSIDLGCGYDFGHNFLNGHGNPRGLLDDQLFHCCCYALHTRPLRPIFFAPSDTRLPLLFRLPFGNFE